MSIPGIPNGRALSPDDKLAIVQRIYSAWLLTPHQRLGQLIVNACGEDAVYSIEDDELAASVERFALRIHNSGG